MKRFVLILMCATLCLCVLAGPVSARGKSRLGQPYRPDTDAQYVWGPWGFGYTGPTETADEFITWWWHETPPPPPPPPEEPDPFYDEYYRPLSNDRPMLAFAITLGVGRGWARHIPNILRFSYDITGVDGEAAGYSAHYGPDEVEAYWTRPYVWDEFWIDFWHQMFGWEEPEPWIPGPFNPRIGARIYGVDLEFPLFPLEGPDGEYEPPSPGTYHVAVSMRQALPSNEMLFWGDDPSLPTHNHDGSWAEDYAFDMVVED